LSIQVHATTTTILPQQMIDMSTFLSLGTCMKHQLR